MSDPTSTPAWGCPFCKALAGEYCRDRKKRWLITPHRARVKLSEPPRKRWRNLTPVPVDEQAESAVEALPKNVWSRIEFTTHCWVWRGAVNSKGYGSVGHAGRIWSTHRLVYLLLAGNIPDGLQLDHLCLNKRCCKPAHLEPVTAAENMRRRHAADKGSVAGPGTVENAS